MIVGQAYWHDPLDIPSCRGAHVRPLQQSNVMEHGVAVTAQLLLPDEPDELPPHVIVVGVHELGS